MPHVAPEMPEREKSLPPYAPGIVFFQQPFSPKSEKRRPFGQHFS
jgi:hypothetical protein